MSAPKTIYLQWDEEFQTLSTWCEDKINDTDTEYVQTDELAQIRSDMKEQQETLDYLTEHIIPKYKADNARLQKAVEEARPMVEHCDAWKEAKIWLKEYGGKDVAI
jgi:predicted outer membrane protein